MGFKKRFVEPILIGTKVFTLRRTPKRMPKVMETIHMYTALRTKHCEHISSKEKLVSMQRVRVLIEHITARHEVLPHGRPVPMPSKVPISECFGQFRIRICVDGKRIDDIDEFVKFDGFKDTDDFCNYWLTDEKGKKKDRTGALLVMFHWTDLRY